MDLVKNVFSSGLGMGTGVLSDTVKLVIIGGTVETARRAASNTWRGFLDSFFLTAHFTQNDRSVLTFQKHGGTPVLTGSF
ncbi:hypothetical protein FRC20_010849 [Serendipita sp. 405]|nr:hypothetical protein FRC20_010849 [Serendipita sp. 405]